MKTIKVSEATGPALDWLVAKCEVLPVARHNTGAIYLIHTPWADKSRVKWLAEYSPTRHWAQGGPIKEKHQISTTYCGGGVEAIFNGHYGQGTTELIATMRCYVTSKLGETAEVPEELT